MTDAAPESLAHITQRALGCDACRLCRAEGGGIGTGTPHDAHILRKR